MAGENFNIPGPTVPGWKLENILPELTRHAVNWIEVKAQAKKPFFLYFSLTSPHYPVAPAEEFVGKTKVGAYGDFVHQTDWSIGQVLDALDRAGVADNTLVIFTSDNGAEITGEVNPGAYDRVQQFGHRSSGELRGAKRDAWEGGHRVPFVVRWPGKIKSRSVSNEIICHVDFMATIAAILGKKLPDNSAEDSFNILPVLLGEPLEAPIREATIHHSARGKFAIRQGDWVLIDAPSGDDNGANGEPMWLKNEREYSAHAYAGELFNLKDDLAQRHNLYADQPERVSELRDLLKKYIENGRSTPGAPQSNDVEIQPVSAVLKQGNQSKIDRETRDVSGWQVHIAKKLLKTEAEDTAKALAGLKKMLDEIVRDVPAAAVVEMKKVPLYFSPAYKPGQSGAEFHPGADWLRDNGRDPAMVRGVEFSGVHDFEAEMRRMPNFALHELAHAYHFRTLPEGFDNAEIKAAYERTKLRGLYDRVERTLGNGNPNTFERAYAMTNAMEYFAETTEAYFSRNDFFPFTREELLRHDPEMHALLEKLWGVSATNWLEYPGGEGPGKGKRIVLIAAEQEYRSEHSMPMMAKILSTHHGFDCTVLFGVNENGEVDPTLPVYPEKGREAEFKTHHIPGLEQLESADLVIFCTRLLSLPQPELQQIVKYVDSGKPIIALRTANHGFLGELPYKIDGKQVRWGEDILGGTFLNHHGRWHADSTRGILDKDQSMHPILAGVTDIWGDTDVYRTYQEGVVCRRIVLHWYGVNR